MTHSLHNPPHLVILTPLATLAFKELAYIIGISTEERPSMMARVITIIEGLLYFSISLLTRLRPRIVLIIPAILKRIE